jgi:hypothetical protein
MSRSAVPNDAAPSLLPDWSTDDAYCPRAQRAIPFNVLPLGFSLDALVWGTALWLLTRGAKSWQRMIR